MEPITLIWPLPTGDVGRIHAELKRVLLARNLLVEKCLADVRSTVADAGHAIDGVDGQTEAIGLIADRQLQRRVDVAFARAVP